MRSGLRIAEKQSSIMMHIIYLAWNLMVTFVAVIRYGIFRNSMVLTLVSGLIRQQ